MFFRLCTKSLSEKIFAPYAFVTSFFNSCPPSSIWDFWPRKTYQQTIRPRLKKTAILKTSKQQNCKKSFFIGKKGIEKFIYGFV